VTLTAYLPRLGLFERPARKPRHPQHRAIDEVERQQILRAGADLLIKTLRIQLDDAEARHAKVIARIDERHGEIVRGLEDQIAEFERKLDVACKAETAVAKTQEFDASEIRARFAAPMPLHQSPMAAT
jgi:hypothetical protein